MAFVSQHEGTNIKPLIWVSEQGTDNCLLDAITQVVSRNAQSLMILSCSANNHSANFLHASFQSCPVPICGGIFPSVFFGDTKLDNGFIIIGFPFSISVACYRLSDQPVFNINAPVHVDGETIDHSSDLLIFIDAMANTIEPFINKLYETIGGGINVIGGGAGSIDFNQRPCVFSRDGLLMNAALVVHMPVPMLCAVRHGWEILSGPYLVTEVDNKKIKTLNYLPAFEVYKTAIEEITAYRFDKHNFFQISQNFPFGVLSVSGDILVRDPIQTCKNDLFCVGSIPVNSMVYVLSGNKQHIIDAAEDAGLSIKREKQAHDDSMGVTLVFDCVSRALYLGDQFPLEMSAMQRGVSDRRTIVGALSIGEIANTSRGTISLLNKSIVVGNI